jgi:hypothetical protein
MKHTPTPWHVTDQSEIEGINIDGLELKSLATMSKSGNITYVHGEMLDSDDAAFIVQACNSHDALVAALETLIRMQVKGHDLIDRMQFSDEGRAISAQVLGALARARGE